MFIETYAEYYDLFYHNKDYAAEARYVLELAGRQGFQPKSLLDLGCGTGRHAVEWAKLGLFVQGIEKSEQMLNRALLRTPEELSHRLNFTSGDLTDFDAQPNTFDIVTAMFAVLGYVIEDGELLRLLGSIRDTLRPDGVFVCDTWHGAAVLREGPGDKVGIYKNEDRKVYRLVKSELDVSKQIVLVHYTVIDTPDPVRVHEETHRMRFFTVAEMRLLAKMSGLSLAHACPFMQPDVPLHVSDWNATWVFRKDPYHPLPNGQISH
jgi:SAM-dependent methyltransferase